ncbi:metal-dependent hydrolase family protein [Herbidospora sp. RD11066]
MSASLRTVFTGGNVFDGTGAAPGPADVAVQDGRIVEVGPGLDGDLAVDLTGRTLLPGFIDCHVHVTLESVDTMTLFQQPYGYGHYIAADNLRKMLAIGITSARDAGGASPAVKQALLDGRIVGPRLLIAIQMLSQSGGHSDGWMPSGQCMGSLGAGLVPGIGSSVVDGVEEMRQRVRELIRAGADQIKIATSGGVLSPRSNPRHAKLTPEEIRVAVLEAQAADIPVMAHAQGTEGIKNAVRAGVRSIEHGIYLDEEAVDLMLEHGTYLVPTLLAPHSVIEATENGATLTDASRRKVHEIITHHQRSFKLAVEAGVRVAMGTDAVGFPHGRNLEELQLMAAAGMPSADVLKATTSAAARLLGIDGDVGTIEVGKQADLVVVAGNPLDFTGLTERIRAVYQAGELVVSHD